MFKTFILFPDEEQLDSVLCARYEIDCTWKVNSGMQLEELPNTVENLSCGRDCEILPQNVIPDRVEIDWFGTKFFVRGAWGSVKRTKVMILATGNWGKRHCRLLEIRRFDTRLTWAGICRMQWF